MQRILTHKHRDFARRAHSRIRAHFCISNESTNTDDSVRRAHCSIRAHFCISNESTNTNDLARRAHSRFLFEVSRLPGGIGCAPRAVREGKWMPQKIKRIFNYKNRHLLNAKLLGQ